MMMMMIIMMMMMMKKKTMVIRMAYINLFMVQMRLYLKYIRYICLKKEER